MTTSFFFLLWVWFVLCLAIEIIDEGLGYPRISLDRVKRWLRRR